VTIPRQEGWYWMMRHSDREKQRWMMAWVQFNHDKQRWVARTHDENFTDMDNEGADFHGPIIPPNLCIY